MPNLLVYIRRGLERKFKVNFHRFKERPDFLIVSPGGCGSITLLKYLDEFGKSNLYFERKYEKYNSLSGLLIGHIYKPNKYLIKNKIKILLIHRNYEDIYKSMVSRRFLRNSLNIMGDCFPFIYNHIFKDELKLKKKYFRYLDFFYNNWSSYDDNLILNLDYPDIYTNSNTQKKIKFFLNIENKDFLKNFPKFKKYKKTKEFVDPSSILMKSIYNIE